MSTKRGGLGRNLSALLSHTEGPLFDETNKKAETLNHSAPLMMPILHLQPGKYQPRREMDEQALTELAESIKKQGLLQPLVVRELSTSQYEIIAGERRWRACQLVGMEEVPVLVRQVDDETAMALALIENLQREDLNAMDQARAMERLISEFALTHQQVAELLCKSRTSVSNYLRLLHLNEDVKRLLEYGDIDMGHARCLLTLDKEKQRDVAEMIVANHLSVRETEKLIIRIKAQKKEGQSPPAPASLIPQFDKKLKILSQHLQARVNIKPGKAGRGQLIIHYEDASQLENMIGQLVE